MATCFPQGGPNGIKNFQSWDWIEILSPGFYHRSPRSLGITLSVHIFGRFYTFWTTYLFVKYIRQTKASSIMAVKVFEDFEYDKSFHYPHQTQKSKRNAKSLCRQLHERQNR